MDGNASGDESCNIDWDTNDEREIENLSPSSSSRFSIPYGNINAGSGEGCSSACSAKFRLIYDMKFPEELVLKAIEQTGGEENFELILDTVLYLQAPKTSPEQHQCVDSERCNDEGFVDDLSNSDNWCGSDNDIAVTTNSSVEDKRMLALEAMGFSVDEASIAIDRCPRALIAELTDFITAAQMAKADDVLFQELPDESKSKHSDRKRKPYELEVLKRRKKGAHPAQGNETIRLPKPMVGFGVPTEEGSLVIHRNLPEAATGPPYFYYENVALAPKGVWDTISRFLYGDFRICGPSPP